MSVLCGDVAVAAQVAMRNFHLARMGIDHLLSDGTEMPDEVRSRLVEIQGVLVLPKRPTEARPVATEGEELKSTQ